MKWFYWLIACCVTCSVHAQKYKTASRESQEYHRYREWLSEPPYGLAKARALSNTFMQDMFKDKNEESAKVAADTYNALSPREKFTYNMIHGEVWHQICALPPPIQDEHKKIFGQLPGVFSDFAWSNKQENFFITNRDSVITWMKDCMTNDKRVGINFKRCLVDLNAIEAIPLLISTYNANPKDHDVLTVLLLLMHNNKYAPFMASNPEKELYNNEKHSGREAFLALNTANEQLIIKQATDFYNGYKK